MVVGRALAAVMAAGALTLVGGAAGEPGAAAAAQQARTPATVVRAAEDLARGVTGRNSGRAEWVRTTKGPADRLLGGGITPGSLSIPVYVVEVTGSFTCPACSGPPGSPSPRGTAVFNMFPATKLTAPGLTMFALGSPVDLARLGRVHTFRLGPS